MFFRGELVEVTNKGHITFLAFYHKCDVPWIRDICCLRDLRYRVTSLSVTGMQQQG